MEAFVHFQCGRFSHAKQVGMCADLRASIVVILALI
jgi:hypothetical protein